MKKRRKEKREKEERERKEEEDEEKIGKGRKEVKGNGRTKIGRKWIKKGQKKSEEIAKGQI